MYAGFQFAINLDLVAGLQIGVKDYNSIFRFRVNRSEYRHDFLNVSQLKYCITVTGKLS